MQNEHMKLEEISVKAKRLVFPGKLQVEIEEFDLPENLGP